MTDTPAPSSRRELVERSESRIAELLDAGGLVLPERYAWRNALKTAWLQLQDAEIQYGQHKGRRLLDVVTEGSVANALLDMVAQGLNVGAKQGYFIPMGHVLTFRRSYFGSIALARRVANVDDVRALPIYEGDELELEVEHGYRRIVSHRQTFASIREGTLVGAYAIVTFRRPPPTAHAEARPDHVDVMTIEEIRTSWSKAKSSGTHGDFPEAMALRTVIQRALKPLINAASDDHLFLEAYNRDPDGDDDLYSDDEGEQANTIDVDVALEAPREEPIDDAPDLEVEDVELEDVEPEPLEALKTGPHAHLVDRPRRRGDVKAAEPLFPEDPGF